MKTYQIEYESRGEWVPGNLVQMEPQHLERYLEFLNGQRPVVRFTDRGVKMIDRDPDEALPTRLKCVEPDWSKEDGYYKFDGASVEYVNLAQSPAR